MDDYTGYSAFDGISHWNWYTLRSAEESLRLVDPDCWWNDCEMYYSTGSGDSGIHSSLSSPDGRDGASASSEVIVDTYRWK